jgi:hypothetical protein
MSFDFFANHRRDQLPTAGGGDLVAEQRARVEQQQELKQQELMEQMSERNTPAQRIVVWERRHGLTLPRNPDHPAVHIVAAATGLALEQIHEEQQRRSASAIAHS